MIINGREYSSDVIIFPERIQTNWCRNKGHELSVADIAEVITENPDVLIVGTGDSGLMKVLPEVQSEAEARDIKLIAKPTNEACEAYNQLCLSQKVGAALHLTC
jgi:hypothetical protein